PHFREDDVPGAQRHDRQDDESGLRDEVALCPERLQSVRILYDCGGLIFHRFLKDQLVSWKRTLNWKQLSTGLPSSVPGLKRAPRDAHLTAASSRRGCPELLVTVGVP